jgi:hypothetical protein
MDCGAPAPVGKLLAMTEESDIPQFWGGEKETPVSSVCGLGCLRSESIVRENHYLGIGSWVKSLLFPDLGEYLDCCF